jgi:TetR/AcrR family transcriptional regulator, fatty acid metabolism regulator protein
MGAGPRGGSQADATPRTSANGGTARKPRGGARPERAEMVDKRRVILDAAVHVFARRGFHSCRVSDVADEAGVAYGLVYHYFGSKEEILDTLFVDRWQLMLDAIEEIDGSDATARVKLERVASFIIDSYRHSPDVMKVIIVEVTRAAHSFGREHLEHINKAYDRIALIVEGARRDGSFKPEIDARFAAMCFYGAIEQLLSGWIFGLLPQTDEEYERAKGLVVDTICGGLEAPGALADAGSGLLPRE